MKRRVLWLSVLLAASAACSQGGTNVQATGGAMTAGASGGGAGAATTGGTQGATGGKGTGGQGAGGMSTGGSGAAQGGGGAGTGGASAGGGNGFSCNGNPYKLCEDFEAGPVAGLPKDWTDLKGYGPVGGVGLTKDQAHGGVQSLQTSTASPGSSRIQKSLASLGTTATKHWGRLFYKVKTPAPVAADKSKYYHITFAALQQPSHLKEAENRVVDTVESPDAKVQYIYNLPDDTCCAGSSYDWTYDGAWHCAEWFVDVSMKSYRFFIDNKEVTSLGFTMRAEAMMGNYTALGLGAIFYVAPNNPLTTWIDDVAIDDKQIGCQ